MPCNEQLVEADNTRHCAREFVLMANYSGKKPAAVDFEDGWDNNSLVLQVATTHVEYPQPLVYCRDAIICRSCL